MKKIILGLVSIFLMSACEESSVENQELSEGSVTGQISAQESGIKYADYNVPDALPWGPSGVFSVRDGYVIPDNVTKKLVTLDENFKVTGGISVGDKAVGITSVVQDTSGLAALDSAAVMPKLLHISPDGFIRSGEIPKMHQTPPSGLMRDDLGLLLEYSGGEYLYRISENDGTVALSQIEGYTLNGKLCYVEKPEAAYFHERRLHIGDKVVTISVPNHLGSVQILGSDTDGNLQVLVEDVSFSPVITVEQTIWSIATSGEILSVSKVPLDQMAFAIAHPVTLSKQGKAVTLVPKDNALQLWKLAPSHPGIIAARAVMPLPSEAQKVTDSVSFSTHPLFVYSGSCLTTLQMLANINEYLNTAAYMQSANIDNSSSCQVRIKPAYLGGPGTYTSVSYDWGGFDTPSAFVSAMSLGKKAGNLDNSTSSGLPCSYGVDCSGFVSRVWGFTSKYGTSTIMSHIKSIQLYTFALALGDALNKVGSHIVILGSNATNGIYTYESTHENNYDRVVYMYRTWSSLSGYQPIRSATSCL